MTREEAVVAITNAVAQLVDSKLNLDDVQEVEYENGSVFIDCSDKSYWIDCGKLGCRKR